MAPSDSSNSRWATTVVLAAQLCDDQRDIDDLDLNPVIVSDSQTLVTDAQVRLVDRPNNDGPIRQLG
ncbi:MAG: hypothetical protein GKR86_06705 [Ilumatobacter sp.]|nr:hypothetical protein [Ilumatobacter sp.]